jgi:hypothetical protein
MSDWGRRTFGDPCRECAYDWSLSYDEVCALVRAIPDSYATILQGCDGTEQIEELSWTVADNLRIWAERLVAATVGTDAHISPYDNELLAAARCYAAVPLSGALWSLGRAVADWLLAVTAAEQQGGVVLIHPERGIQTVLDTIRNNAHDAFHHGWDLARIIGTTAAQEGG